MPTPLEICLEEIALPPEAERLVRCVALPGGQPGLALDRQGAVRWMPDGPADYGLWVSADDQLILRRAPGAGPITVSRGGRELEAPTTKPVVLRDQDVLRIDGHALRVHVHGLTDVVHPPERLSRSALGRAARATAAALALGAAVAAGGVTAAGPPPIEVRDHPPEPMPQSVICDVTAVKPSPGRKGSTTIYATCRGPTPPVGSNGELLDAKDVPIPQGQIVVKQVNGKKIVGETPLTKVKPVRARFYY
jgi:hypothetical protein